MKDEMGYTELGDLFYRVLSKYLTSEKIPKDFGIGEKLYPSEIHTIHAIGINPGINVTDLAKFLGITKGAVPKMIRKLKAKGLVESFEKSENRKVVHLRLTSKGKKAHRGYLRFHEKRNMMLKEFYHSLSKKEIDIIRKAFIEMGRYADKILEE